MVSVRTGASRRGVGGKSVTLRNGDQEDWEMAIGGRGPLIIRGRSVATQYVQSKKGNICR